MDRLVAKGARFCEDVSEVTMAKAIARERSLTIPRPGMLPKLDARGQKIVLRRGLEDELTSFPRETEQYKA